MPAATAGNGVAKEYLRRFPKAATRTLARKCYKEHPKLWPTLDACQSSFRRLRGAHGKHNRKATATKENYKPLGQAGNAFKPIPPGIKHLRDAAVLQVDDPGTWLLISDLHVPYHDAEAVEEMLGLANSAVGIIINGDLMDCFAISNWQKNPDERDFENELQTTREVFWSIRARFPKKRIIWKWGNHEERYQRYFEVKAPELLGVDAFTLEAVTEVAKYGVEVVKGSTLIRLGKLWVIHGHEYRTRFAAPENPAAWMLKKAKESVLFGHFHRTNSDSRVTLSDHTITCWSTGCLCDRRPDYRPLNEWNLGGAIVEVGEDGSYEVENRRVIHGKSWK
jgi:predicted phosphodiesterase